MTLIQTGDGKNILYDCNITSENENSVIPYLAQLINWYKPIDIFINSHRDADHMRGVRKINKYFPIQKIWDSGVTGTTPDSIEYREYMDLRRSVGFIEVVPRRWHQFGTTRLRIMNAKNDQLASNANAQSVVIKVVEMDVINTIEKSSTMLCGDTDAATWKYIRNHYMESDLSCEILLASHHGSITYFDDPSDRHYYLDHLRAKAPAMTIISVGKNAHGHPNETALAYYEKHSRGSSNGTRLYRTDKVGNMKLELKASGGWQLNHGLI